MRYAERPRDVGQRLASVTSCSGFLLLVVIELRWPAHVLASGLGPGSAVAGALADQMPLELSQATQDCQDEPAVRCGRVGPGISSDLKPAPFSGDFASLDASTYRIDGEGFIHIAGQDSEGKSHDFSAPISVENAENPTQVCFAETTEGIACIAFFIWKTDE